jgi:integrase
VHLDAAIAATNASLRTRGIRLAIEQRRSSLCLRGTWTNAAGERRQQRLPLGLAATPSGLVEAEGLAVQVAAAIAKGEAPESLVATRRPQKANAVAPPVTVAAAIAAMERDYWATRARTSTSERSWARLRTELNRLPPGAPLTLELLEATVLRKTEPNSRTRKEACMTYARLGRAVSLQGVDGLARLRGRYEPEPRDLLNDSQILQLVEALRPTSWGWCLAVMATYGVRPGEVPSVVPGDDGTAQSLTLKRHHRAPAPRTCFALPAAWIERLQLNRVEIPHGARWTRPEEYDSDRAKRWGESFYRAMRTKPVREALADIGADELDLYGLRHAWARRSIEAGLPLTLCAKAMGHSAATHEQAYHRWIAGGDLRAAQPGLADPPSPARVWRMDCR